MSNYIVCPHCEKKIEFERPLFCPFCGKQLEPVDDLVDGNESDIYPWSNSAPILMKLFMYWVAAVIPITAIFGRKAFVVSFLCLFILLIVYSLIYLFKPTKSEGN